MFRLHVINSHLKQSRLLPEIDAQRKLFSQYIKKSSVSIRTPMLIKGRLERTETNLMHFKWEET